jgi:hypothetical protein
MPPEMLIKYLGRDKTSLYSLYYIMEMCTCGTSLTQISSCVLIFVPFFVQLHIMVTKR